MELKPFACSGCGALLPLGAAATARCSYCNAETKVPDEYGKVQRAAKSFADDKKLAESLYGRIGKPPGWFARLIGRGSEEAANIGARVVMVTLGLASSQPLIGIGIFMAGAYVLGYPVAAAVRGGYWISGHPAPAALSPFPILAAATLVVIFGFGIPSVLYGKERALSDVRIGIHASMAAALPEKPGGPSRCRNCGAALDVPSGAAGVPCVYCKADNLVALPQAWVTHIRASEFKQFLQIDAAIEAFRLASEAATEKIWKLALAVVLAFPAVMLVAWFLDAAKIYY